MYASSAMEDKPANMIGWLQQGIVMLTDPDSVRAALSEGYGAKLRRDITLPRYQNDTFVAPAASEQDSTEVAPSEGSLTLLDEEAAYLTLIEKLQLRHKDGSMCSFAELWNEFQQRNCKFAANMRVYMFYRSQGYCIRSGIHYGVDFSVYRDHPTKCHSEICVVVVSDGSIDASVQLKDMRPCSSSSGEEIIPVPSSTVNSSRVYPELSWRGVSTLTRVMPDVMKLLVMCYVTENTDKPPPAASERLTVAYMENWGVRPVCAISRRLNNRSEEFSNIRTIQQKYYQLSKLAVARKAQPNKTKRKARRAVNEFREKKKPRTDNDTAKVSSRTIAGSETAGASNNGSSTSRSQDQPIDSSVVTSSNGAETTGTLNYWRDYVRNFFSSSSSS